MEWVESTGASIEEAKERALDQLGVHGDDAEFEVVADVKTGLFGRVKEEARVRARVRPATPRAKEDRGRSRGRGGRSRGGRGDNRKSQGQKRQGGQAKKKSGGGGSSRQDRGDTGSESRRRSESRETTKSTNKSRNDTVNDDEPTMPLTEQADLAETFVKGLADRFGTEVAFTRTDVDDDEIRITVTGDDLGRMIGRRGSTAGAIDELVRTVLQRQAGSARNGRIRVDVGGVRARRAEALAAFSKQQAEEVRASGGSRALEPMNAADRKIVHDALTDEPGVDTISEGEDPRRRVVIVPAEAGD